MCMCIDYNIIALHLPHLDTKIIQKAPGERSEPAKNLLPLRHVFALDPLAANIKC